MHRCFTLAIVFCGIFLAPGCGGSEPIVATIGTERITLRDFEESYSKNNGGWDAGVGSTLDDRQKFLDLLLKFRLKVQEAIAQGLLRDSLIQSELDNYSNTVAQTYMLDKELIEPHLKNMYERRKEELRASQILVRVPPEAPASDTLAAYQKAMKVINLIPQSRFDSLVSAYSEDPTALSRGDVGFFSVGRFVPEIEDAAYNLKQGEYTRLPVRTRFGYHVLKLTARNPNPGLIQISHILLNFAPSRVDTSQVRDSIWMVYRKIKSGMDFGEAARQYSHDPGSVSRGGDLGFYQHDRLPADIATALLNLPVDSITQPMRYPYGYHIFKVTGRKALPAYADQEKELRSIYQQQRYEWDRQQYVDRLLNTYHVTIDWNVLRQFSASVDSTKTPADSAWDRNISAGLRGTPVISSTSLKLTIQKFCDQIQSSTDYQMTALTAAKIESIAHHFAENQALEEHARRASERHPAFARLMHEFEEGILLYRIEQDEIWKKVVANDSLLKMFYDQSKERYRWPERVNFAEIYVLSDSAAKAAYWQIQYGEDFLAVAKEQTMRSGYREKSGVWGYQALDLNDLTRKAASMAKDSVTAPFPYQSGWSIIKAMGKDSARVKSFEEAGPELASSYQEHASKEREQEWIEMLRKKYGIVINKEVLGEAFKKKNAQSN